MGLKNLLEDVIAIRGIATSWNHARENFSRFAVDIEENSLEGKSLLGSFVRNLSYGLVMTAVQAGELYLAYKGIEYTFS